MKCLLINAPQKFRRFEENLRTVSEDFGVYPPLNLAYIAAMMEEKGHKPKIIDANALKLTKKEALSEARPFKPDIILFNLHSVYNFRDTVKWISFFKKAYGVPIIVGGLTARSYTKEVLSYPCIDFVYLGSVLNNFIDFIETLHKGENYSDMPGVCFRIGKKVKINQPQSYKEDLDSLPLPARHLLPNDKYYQFISKRKNFTIMLSSVGCPYNCSFCCIPFIWYKARDPQKVVDEMEECYKKYGVREIDFFDACFTVSKKRVIEMCRELRRRGLDIHWSCRARIDNVDDEMLREMSWAGCKRIYYGIETIDKATQKKIRKTLSQQKIEEAISLTKKHDILTLGFFMIGNEGDTRRTALNNVAFAKKLGLDYVQFSRTIAKPDSELNEKLIKITGKDYWRDYILGKVRDRRLPNPWSNLSEKQIERYTQLSYILFYFRPVYLLKYLLTMKSFHEFKRTAVSAYKMIFIK